MTTAEIANQISQAKLHLLAHRSATGCEECAEARMVLRRTVGFAPTDGRPTIEGYAAVIIRWATAQGFPTIVREAESIRRLAIRQRTPDSTSRGVCKLMDDGVPHGPHKVSDQHFCGGVPTEVWADLANDLGDFLIATPVPVGDQQFEWKHRRDRLLNRLDALSGHTESPGGDE